MKRIILASLMSLAITAPVFAAQPQVTICHIPPGNPANPHEITVGQPAVAAHLGHGDTMGNCPNPIAGNLGASFAVCDKSRTNETGRNIDIKAYGHTKVSKTSCN